MVSVAVVTWISGTTLTFVVNGRVFVKDYLTELGVQEAQNKLVELGLSLGVSDIMEGTNGLE